MTEEERLAIKRFDARTRHLIAEYKKLQDENKFIKACLKEKDEEIASLKSIAEQSQRDYNNLKVAKMVSISDNDLKNAKQRITNLVREVNKCINMLKAGDMES